MTVTVSVDLDEDLVTKLEDYEPRMMSLSEAAKMALEEFFQLKPSPEPNR